MDRSGMCGMLSGIANRLSSMFLNGELINRREPIDWVIYSQLGLVFLRGGRDLSQHGEKRQGVTRAAA